MSKASIQNVIDEGFRPEQFGFATGAGTGWNDAGGYIDAVVQEAGRWAADRVGASVYAAVPTPSYVEDCLRRAEVCFCRARLFRRRVAFLDSSATVGLGQIDTQYLNRREMLAHADAAWQCALDAIAEAIRETGGDPAEFSAGGASLGFIETGQFPHSTVGALNA